VDADGTEFSQPTARQIVVIIRQLLSRWIDPLPFEKCPACGGNARGHAVRLLARERFSPGVSGIEGLLARRDFARAAALDDRRVLGDELVHRVMRCGAKAIVVTTQEPSGLGLEPRIRRTLLLEGDEANAAWKSAR
jgi:hypothetical protein